MFGFPDVEFDVGDRAEVMNYPVQYSRHQINAGKHGYWLAFLVEALANGRDTETLSRVPT
jgi:hypothetical protein